MKTKLERALGCRVETIDALAGGQIGRVVAATLTGGERVVAKSSAGLDLEVEAQMLTLLRRRTSLPVPDVLFADADLLVLGFLPGSASLDRAAEAHLGELVASLHEVLDPRFGLDFDTLIGRFPQANARSDDWADFFVARRLRPMAALAAEQGALPARTCRRLAALEPTFAAILAEHHPRPALLHGDLWSGNVLAEAGRVTGVLDPALYFGDPEVDLAYVALFDSFGPAFWSAYESRRTPEPGAALRRPLYQLYPLLSHLAHFGRRYLLALEARLERLEAAG